MPQRSSMRSRVLFLLFAQILIILVAAAIVSAAPDQDPGIAEVPARAFAPGAITADTALELAIVSSPYAIVDHNQPESSPHAFVVEAVITNTGLTTAVLPYLDLDYDETGDWLLLETETLRRTPELAPGEVYHAYWFATYPLLLNQSHVYTVTAGADNAPMIWSTTNAFLAGDTVRTIRALEGGTSRLEESTTDIIVGVVFTATIEWSLGTNFDQVLLSPVGNVDFDPASYRLVGTKVSFRSATTPLGTYYDRLYFPTVPTGSEFARGEFIFLALRTNETQVCPYCAPLYSNDFKYDNGFCETSLPISGTVTLSLTKSVNATQVQQGEPLTYTIAYTNTGTYRLGNVWIWDDVDRGLGYITAASGAPAVLSDTQVAWNIGSVGAAGEPGSTGVLTFAIQVDGNDLDLDDQAPIANNAFFGIDPTAVPANPALTSTVTSYVQAPVLIVSKSDGLDVVPAGDPLTYTLYITNVGHMTATGIVITDELPAEVGGGVHNWSLPDLAPLGGFASVQLPTTVPASTVNDTVLTNTMTAEYQNPAGYTYDTETATDTTTVRAPSWLLTKSDEPDPVVAGTVLTYTLSYLNNTVYAAYDVALTDTLPTGTTFGAVVDQTATWPSFTVDPGPPQTLTWYTPTLASGDSGTLVVTVTVSPDASGALLNNAIITGTANAVPTYALAVESTTVNRVADVALDKEDGGQTATAGLPFTYTLTISNHGPSGATGIIVTDTLPAGTSFVSASGATCAATGLDLACDPFAIASGDPPVVITVVVDVSASVPHGEVLHNVAAAHATETDPNGANNSDDEFTFVSAEADLSIDKSVTPSKVAAGATLTYTLVYTNAGPSDAQSVQITDTLSAKVSFGGLVSADPALPGFVQVGQQVAWSTPTLAAGAVGTIVYTATVHPGASGLVSNTALITSTTYDPVEGDNTATAEATIGAPDRATLYGYVFEDADCDGQKDPGEPGLPGVTVTLDGTSATTTDADGLYLFFVYAEGIHTVVETDPDGYFSTTPNEVHVDVAFANSYRVDFGDGPGSAACAAISGIVYEDLDGSRTWDSGELGIPGVTVTLEVAATTVTVQTGAYGAYSFATTYTGTHWIRETDPEGYFSTTPNDVPVDVEWGNGYTVDFGDAPVTSPFGVVFGTVFDDANHNGLWDSGEFGIPGVQISSTLAATSPVFTNQEGEYGFRYDLPGSATITETNPLYYVSTTPDVVYTEVLTGSDNGSPHNFGDFMGIKFVGQVWYDANVDGEKDGEDGLAGAVVTASAAFGATDAYTTTATGFFTLYHTVSGTLPITVTETNPAGHVSTVALPGEGVTTVDADTLRIGLPLSGTVYSGDFGDVQATSAITISGWVWDDRGTVACPACLANGIFDPGEPFLPGAIISLTSGLSQTTGSDGSWQLYGPANTVITVTEQNPDGYVSTNALPGSADVTKIDNDTLVVRPLPGQSTAAGNLFGDVSATSTAILTGTVYDDANENGILDAGELGLSGVDVTLQFSDLSTITVQTNAWGHYQFAVAPGTQVRITSAGPGGAYYPTTLETLTLTPPDPVTYPNNNFGYSDDTDVTVIYGIVFDDDNGDGVQDSGELGLAGAVITLTQESTVLSSITTTGTGLITGTFTFSVPRPALGTVVYNLNEKNPPGYHSTTPDLVVVPIIPTTTSEEVNFGDRLSSLPGVSFFGTVFEDQNVDGAWDLATEPGIPGVTVEIAGTSPVDPASYLTNQWGQYTFLITATGTYTVTETDLAGYVSTIAIPGDPAVWWVDDNTLATEVTSVTPGSELPGNLFGDALTSQVITISGTVWDDNGQGVGGIANDGQRNGDEPGLAGAYLALSSGLAQTTGPDGAFRLYAPPGVPITLTEANPPGYLSTNAIEGNDAGYVDDDTLRISGLFGGETSSDNLFGDVRPADLEVVKSGAPDPVQAGTTLTYTLVFTNHGPSYAQAVVITDSLDSSVTFGGIVEQPVAASGPAQSGQTLVWTLPDLTSGDGGTIVFTVTVDTGVATGYLLDNAVTIHSNHPDTEPGNNTDQIETLVQRLADLSIAKSDGDLTATAGLPFTYTLTVANHGPSDASGIVVTDTLPAGMAFDSATGATCAASGQEVTCDPIGIAFGDDPVVITVVVDVEPWVAHGAELENSAAASGAEDDPDTENNTATETTPVQREADVTIAKGDGELTATAGLPFTYTLTVANHGPSDASGIVVTDTLPAGMAFDSATGATCAASGQEVTCDPIGIAFGHDPVVITVVVDVEPWVAHGAELKNAAAAFGAEFDPDTESNTATETTPVERSADLSIDKLAHPDPVAAGVVLTYTLTVVNHGPSDATGIAVADPLPAGVTFDSQAASQGSYDPGTGLWTIGDLALDASATLTLVVTVDSATTEDLTNIAAVSGNEDDPVSTNDSVTLVTRVTLRADLAIAKSDDPNPVIAGQLLTYTLTITNEGPSDATGIEVSDPVPAGTTYASSDASQGSYDDSTGIWTVGPVAYDASASLTLVVTVDSDTLNSVSNTATVGGDEYDPAIGNNSTTIDTAVETEADLSITKTDDPDPVVAGLTLTYTLAFANTGPSDALDVEIADTLSADVAFDGVVSQDAALTGPAQSGQLLTWTLSRLAAGDAGSIVFTVAVTDTAIVTIANHVAIDSGTFDPETANNSAREETEITCLPDGYEDDDDLADAVPLLRNQTRAHSFCKDPTDWSMFTVRAGHVYTITTSSWGRRADTFVELYDRDGMTLLAANDDYEGATDHSSRIVWRALSDGTYYLRTSSRAALTGNLTDYDISLVHDDSTLVFLPIVFRSFAPSPAAQTGAGDESAPAAGSGPENASLPGPQGVINHVCMDDFEVDDTWEMAMPIADGETQVHSFDSDPVRWAADKDLVSFDLLLGRTITFTAQTTNTVTLMELFDSEGNALDVTGTDQLVWTAPEPGIYILSVSPQTDTFGCADEAGYRLHAAMNPRWYLYLPIVMRNSASP